MKPFPHDPDALHAVLDASPSAVIVVRADGTLDYANENAATLFGFTTDELIGRPVAMLLPEASEQSMEERLRLLLSETKDGSQILRDHLLRRADGTEFLSEMSMIPLMTPDGLRLVSSVRDLTEQRLEEARMRDLTRAYLSLVEMNQAIVRAPDEATLFAETCRIAVAQGGYIGAWVAQPDADGVVRRAAVAGAPEVEEFLREVAVSLDPSVLEGRSPTAEALREGRAVFSAEHYKGRSLEPRDHVAAKYGIKGSAAFPLSCGGRTVAVLALYASRDDRFDDEMKSLLQAMSDNVSLALERFRDAAELHSLAVERRDLSRRLVVAQEDERSRIAADVHDDSVQALAAADLRLGLVRRRLLEQAPHLAPELERAQQTLGDVTAGLRDLLFDLEPADLGVSLIELVRQAADHVFEDAGISWTLELSDPWDPTLRLSQTDRSQALRIVKEALFNVRKHAGASWVHIEVAPGLEGVEFSVRDDGHGFDPETVASQRGHRGLANMRDRAAVSGGWCRIERADPWMAVRFWLPYSQG